MSRRKLRSVQKVGPSWRSASENSSKHIPSFIPKQTKEAEKFYRKLNKAHDQAEAAGNQQRASMIINAGTRHEVLQLRQMVLGMMSEMDYRTRKSMFKYMPWMIEAIEYGRLIVKELRGLDKDAELPWKYGVDIQTWLTEIQVDSRKDVEDTQILTDLELLANEWSKELERRLKFASDLADERDNNFLDWAAKAS